MHGAHRPAYQERGSWGQAQGGIRSQTWLVTSRLLKLPSHSFLICRVEVKTVPFSQDGAKTQLGGPCKGGCLACGQAPRSHCHCSLSLRSLCGAVGRQPYPAKALPGPEQLLLECVFWEEEEGVSGVSGEG